MAYRVSALTDLNLNTRGSYKALTVQFLSDSVGTYNIIVEIQGHGIVSLHAQIL